jgi:hypothetical protein
MSREDGRTGCPSVTWSWDALWHVLETQAVCYPSGEGRDDWRPKGYGKQVADAVQQLQESGRLTTAQIDAVANLCKCIAHAARAADG